MYVLAALPIHFLENILKKNRNLFYAVAALALLLFVSLLAYLESGRLFNGRTKATPAEVKSMLTGSKPGDRVVRKDGIECEVMRSDSPPVRINCGSFGIIVMDSQIPLADVAKFDHIIRKGDPNWGQVPIGMILK